MSDHSPTHQLRLLVKEHAPLVFVCTDEEHLVIDAVQKVADKKLTHLRKRLILWDAMWGLHDGWQFARRDIPAEDEPTRSLLYAMRMLLSDPEEIGIAIFYDGSAFIEDPFAQRAMKALIQRAREEGSTIVCVDGHDRWPDDLKRLGVICPLSLPGESYIRRQVQENLQRAQKKHGPDFVIDIKRSNVEAVVNNLRGLTLTQIDHILKQCVKDGHFGDKDLDIMIAGKQQALQSTGLLEFVTAPAELDEIGGLSRMKAWLRARRNSLDDNAQKWGLRPTRGVLLLGVQGAGKSYCAKAIATAWQRPLLRLDPAVLYDKFIGQSEQQLRQALQQAEAMAPVVLWIDEIEKGFAGAAAKSIDGGLTQRMFGAFLTWMQEHQSHVFVVATANNIEALPPELMRKGRFDEIFFVDLPTAEARADIWNIHLTRRQQDISLLDVNALVGATDGFSGAEIEQVLEAALYEALSSGEAPSTDELLAAITGTKPLSVTMYEKVAHLRNWAIDRCVPAD